MRLRQQLVNLEMSQARSDLSAPTECVSFLSVAFVSPISCITVKNVQMDLWQGFWHEKEMFTKR